MFQFSGSLCSYKVISFSVVFDVSLIAFLQASVLILISSMYLCQKVCNRDHLIYVLIFINWPFSRVTLRLWWWEFLTSKTLEIGEFTKLSKLKQLKNVSRFLFWRLIVINEICTISRKKLDFAKSTETLSEIS